MEIREERVFPLELRLSDDKKKIRGYAAVFNQWSEDLGGFREKIRQGAFAKTIKEADVRALFNHDPNYVLGRNKAGTLSLSEDDKGLAIEVDPPDTQWARDLLVSIDRGDINQMSFGFSTIKDEWAGKDGDTTRELVEVKLYDVSPVTYPAYPQTSVGVRSVEIDKMRAILLKHEHGIPVSEEDRTFIEDTIKVLETISPAPEREPEQDEPEPEFHSVKRKLQELRLVEASIEMKGDK